MATRTERNAARRTIYPSPNAVAIVSDNTIRFVNEAFVRLVHASTPQDLIGKSALGLIHGDSNTVAHQLFEEGDKRTTVQAAVLRLLKLDGTTVDVDVRCESIDHGGERGFLLALTDLDWSSAHDLAIERLNRLYAALAHVNQAIVRMPTRQDLFQSVCDALVEQGAVRMAWIAWKSEDELEELFPVAACGDDGGYLNGIRIFTNDTPAGNRPANTAFRQGRPFVCNDTLADLDSLPWSAEIARQGYGSCASFPIRMGGSVSGVLNVYASDAGFFQQDEITLLSAAAADISFGLDNILREQEQQKSDVVRANLMMETHDLRSAIDQHALVAITDPRGKITFANDKFCAVSGYSREELIGQDHRIINSGYHAKAIIRNLWDTIKHGKVWHGELRNKAKDGTFYWVDTTIVPFMNKDGTPRQYMAIRALISNRKQAELALQHERERAKIYLDTAQVMLLSLDLNARIMLVNRHACSVLGWAAEDLRGCDFIERCVPERLRETSRGNLARVRTGVDSVIDNLVLTKSGDERLIEWRATLMRDDEGQVIGTVSSGIDVTERHQAADALKSTEERMRFALDGANVGVWDLDYTTGLLRGSAIFESHLGLEPGTFGNSLDALVQAVHPADRDSMRATIAEATASGGDFSAQHRILKPDGIIAWLVGTGRVYLAPDGEPLRAAGITLDVTESRKLEMQYQQAQKMEAIGQLAGGVAHDFNNLLTVILGYAQLLLNDMAPQDPRRTDITEIQNAGKSAAGLTRQLLAFSRKQIIEPGILDLNEIVTNTRDMLTRLIGENVEIVVTLAPHLDRVKADRGQLEQVIMNLAVNARDAMPNGGTMTIETANVEIDEYYAATRLSSTPGPYVMLTVSDTGTGMTPAVQARLFEPFFTTKDPGKGTGLGLATVHGIVARNGGSINVYSEPGLGSTFRVYFPRAEADSPLTDVPEVPAAPTTRAATVLVVEDADGLRTLVTRMLTRLGCNVFAAQNAAEAIQLFDANTAIDLVLTDVVMPGISGAELARQLLDRRPALKVIYMSGYTNDAIVKQGVLNPGISLLNKPFTADNLAHKLREVLGS